MVEIERSTQNKKCPNCDALLSITKLLFCSKTTPQRCQYCDQLVYKNHIWTGILITIFCSFGIITALLYGMSFGLEKTLFIFVAFFSLIVITYLSESFLSHLKLMSIEEHQKTLRSSKYRAYIILSIIVFSLLMDWGWTK